MKKTKVEEYQPVAVITDEQARDFEKVLAQYKSTAIRDYEIEYYGRPLKQIEGMGNVDGFVVNEIIGGVHWSIVKYCLENKIIGKRGNQWFVVAEVLEKWTAGRCETNAFDSFKKKWSALENLRERRQFAKDKENESFGGGRSERIKELLKKTKAALMSSTYMK